MIGHPLSACLRDVRESFAPYCISGVALTPEATRQLVSLLVAYELAARDLEGTPCDRASGVIIDLRDYEVTRIVPIERAGEVS